MSNAKNLYIAWSNKQDSYSFIATLLTVKELGYTPVVLPMIKSTDLHYEEERLVDATDEHGILLSECASKVKQYSWRHSNVEEVLGDIDHIIFPGGSDISPTLCQKEQPWHGIKEDTEFSAERDVSDYILMSYVIEHNIPMLAICRGMQLLSILRGASIISHIPTYLRELGIEENELHRDSERLGFVPHDVMVIDKDSLLYQSVKTLNIEKVPSWHHQGVRDIKNTDLVVTGITKSNNISIIEAVELKDKKFCLGVQFHPEVAVRKWAEKESNAASFMDIDSALSFFRLLIKEAK